MGIFNGSVGPNLSVAQLVGQSAQLAHDVKVDMGYYGMPHCQNREKIRLLRLCHYERG